MKTIFFLIIFLALIIPEVSSQELEFSLGETHIRYHKNFQAKIPLIINNYGPPISGLLNYSIGAGFNNSLPIGLTNLTGSKLVNLSQGENRFNLSMEKYDGVALFNINLNITFGDRIHKEFYDINLEFVTGTLLLIGEFMEGEYETEKKDSQTSKTSYEGFSSNKRFNNIDLRLRYIGKRSAPINDIGFLEVKLNTPDTKENFSMGGGKIGILLDILHNDPRFLDYNNELLENGYNLGKLINYTKENSTILKYDYTRDIRKVAIVAEFSNTSLNRVYRETNTLYLILIFIAVAGTVVIIIKVLEKSSEKEDGTLEKEVGVKNNEEFDYQENIKKRITLSKDFLGKKDYRKSCSYLGKAIRLYVCSKGNIKGFISDRVAIGTIDKGDYEKEFIEILQFCRKVLFKDLKTSGGEIKEKIIFAKSKII